MSLRDEVLAALQLAREPVVVPKLGKTLYVTELDASDFVQFWGDADAKFSEDERKNGRRVLLVARCTVDENGERVFTDDDVSALAEGSGAIVNSLFAAAGRLNGLLKDDEPKNSETSQSDTSDSGSP
jgi:hypothetical protein